MSKQHLVIFPGVVKNIQVCEFDDGHYFVHTQAKKVAKIIKAFANGERIPL